MEIKRKEAATRRVAKKPRAAKTVKKRRATFVVDPPLPVPWKPELPRPVLTVRVATDCSGLDTVIGCLEDLSARAHHVFSSERNGKLRNFIASRFSPARIYPDMRERKQRDPLARRRGPLLLRGGLGVPALL